MVRSTVRRAAALAATGALAVLAGAGPALAADGGHAPRAVAAVSGAQAAAADPKPATPWCPPHHHGLLSGLLEGVVHLVDGLL